AAADTAVKIAAIATDAVGREFQRAQNDRAIGRFGKHANGPARAWSASARRRTEQAVAAAAALPGGSETEARAADPGGGVAAVRRDQNIAPLARTARSADHRGVAADAPDRTADLA